MNTSKSIITTLLDGSSTKTARTSATKITKELNHSEKDEQPERRICKKGEGSKRRMVLSRVQTDQTC